MTNQSKGDYSYALLDVDSEVAPEVEEQLRQVDGVLRVRVIR